MLELQEAKDFLRVDGTDNDKIIEAILDSIPPYIEVSTGMDIEQQKEEPMVKQVSKFILSRFYNAEQTDSERIDKVISSLLYAIKTKVL